MDTENGFGAISLKNPTPRLHKYFNIYPVDKELFRKIYDKQISHFSLQEIRKNKNK